MKFCAIGLGRMGRRHLQVAKNLGFKIAGVYDPLQTSIDSAIEEHGLTDTAVFDSPGQMLETVRPDALVVASTAPSHCEYVCLAASMNVRYILCEKPMAVSIADCRRMIESCRRSGSTLAVNHQMRFMEQYTLPKTLASSPDFGGICSVTVTGSNIGLSMNGAHYFEMFRFITDEEIRSVSFWADEAKVPNPRGPQYEDRSGQLRGLTASGKRLYMEVGADQGHGIQVVYGCRHGQILVDELAGFVRTIRRKEEFRTLPTTRYGMPAETETFHIQPADVIEPSAAVWAAMIAGNSHPDGHCGLHTVSVLVAANMSCELSGQPLNVNTHQGENRVFPWA